jgi:hypothetical protein
MKRARLSSVGCRVVVAAKVIAKPPPVFGAIRNFSPSVEVSLSFFGFCDQFFLN